MREWRGAVICVVLGLIGIGLSAYMAFLHLALERGELIGGAACGAAGSMFNCHAVTASPFGAVLGVPLALWGVLGYLAAITLAVIAWQRPQQRPQALRTLALLSGLFVVADVGLLAVMLIQIRYLCPLCLGTYAVSVALLVVSMVAAGQPWGRVISQGISAAAAFVPSSRAPVGLGFSGVMLVGALGVLAVHASTRYVMRGPPGAMRRQMVEYVKRQPRHTVKTAGDPVLGDPSRPVRVVEFSDFKCPSCQKGSKFMPIILAGHRQDISFIFKHFPLDQECNNAVNRTVHAGACQLAAATECAHEQGKFWELHDRIFLDGPTYTPARLQQDVEAAHLDAVAFQSCMDSGRGMEAVRQDVAEAKRLEVSSTPTYIVNGVKITGVLPPATFDELLRASR